MDTGNSNETTAGHQKPKKLIRSQFKDIMVKVDEDIYYLDRLRLALKSGYFEKLFTGGYRDGNCDLIEIPVIDTDTFSTVVDIIYGEELIDVINDDNYASLLMAMEYLQVGIDEDSYRGVLSTRLCSRFLNRPITAEIFRLYSFITETGNYQSLLPVVLQHLSLHMLELQDHDEYLSIPFDHYIHIIAQQDFRSNEEIHTNQKHALNEVCGKWICHDIENRLPCMIKLVNAARFRSSCPNKLSYDDTNLRLPAIDQSTNVDKVSRYFYKFFTYTGEIIQTVDELRSEVYEDEKYQHLYRHVDGNCSGLTWLDNLFPDEGDPHDWIVPNKDSKLEAFLRNGHLYDITVKAGEKLYKLHRAVLKYECMYFKEIFSKEFSVLAAQCEGTPPTPPSKDKIYFIDDIDSPSFDSVVDRIYKLRKQTEFTSVGIVRLFKAAHKLKIGSLMNSCENWMMSHSRAVCAEDVVELLNFTRENFKYRSLHEFFLTKYVIDSWPKIDNLLQFSDLFKAIGLQIGEDNTVDISDKTDQETFKLIVDYMFLNTVFVEYHNLLKFLIATEFFRIKKLVERCALVLMLHQDRIKSEDVIDVVEVLNFARRNIEFREALNSVYLAKYMIKWPNVDNSLFCSISYNCLENLLTSPEFLLDDPLEILDMCSKWVMHDVENRYCLISRIAFAISQNHIVDCDDYPIPSPADFNNCSQDSIKEKLWEILASTSVLPFAVLSIDESKMRKTRLPVFITRETEGGVFKIFDSNWDEIDSFVFRKNTRTSNFKYLYPMSACVINDNLFLLRGHSNCSGFYVFNLLSKKLFSLASDVRLCKTKSHYWCQYTLLNCRNEIYNCLEDGEIFKYSFELNRWMRFAKPELDKGGFRFACDGEKLYRMCKIAQTGPTTDFIMEEYSFEQKSWISVPNSRLQVNLPHDDDDVDDDDTWMLPDLIHLNDNNGFAALFEGQQLFRFDPQEESWRNIDLWPYNDHNSPDKYCTIGQNETGQMLLVIDNLVYCLDDLYNSWELIKEYTLSYEDIEAIHTPSIYV
ncbi:uncharacterized protein LOC135849170 isoform X4 [Planococcus citri]|uniref:uncharacterized protein LOC135849170 isoform X4 n=1 Tax=Planococcus citri TaxID=170843 RepID=UPI0031F83DC0